jgi:tetratricopeptide (TPR) repeat protein
MLGKVARALIRNEAAAYRAQGLQEEALALFRQALASSRDLPADVRTSMEREIQQIEEELAGAGLEEGQQLSEEQIAVIRQGWSENASADELVVCANSLHVLGRYGDALQEFRKSIQKGYSPRRVIGSLADCLAHLHEPRHLLGVIDGLTADMAQSNKERFNITLALAEQMWKTGHGEHAAAIARHLAGYKGVPRDYRTRLDALLKSIQSGKTLKRPIPDPDSQTFVEPSSSGSIFERIRRALRSGFSKFVRPL